MTTPVATEVLALIVKNNKLFLKKKSTTNEMNECLLLSGNDLPDCHGYEKMR